MSKTTGYRSDLCPEIDMSLIAGYAPSPRPKPGDVMSSSIR